MTEERDEITMLGMGSGNGFEFEEPPPLRVTGYICFLLGVLSFFSILFEPMLLVALGSILFGLIALRKYDGPRPAGTLVAMWGIILSVGFGTCGYTIPMLKKATLSRQAEEFAGQYIELIALGHDEHAMELKKEWYNRLSTDMNLADHYLSDQRISESLVQFKTDVVNRELKRRGPKAKWELDRPIRIYFQYGKEHAEVIWSDPTGDSEMKIQMFMDYRVDSTGKGQWQMSIVQQLRRRLVAESVL
ncbi:MAG: hypothetical protein L7W43_12480 [Rubripirellula sp.]|nr:hypothetical protein [Rhodopirellula sp.]MCH1440468.1 hypothetical protein [Rubripirellula sp.]OUX08667.1 MAG: hypothetical protein CBE00_01310 [Planctomycetaceae bacterium TMED240]